MTVPLPDPIGPAAKPQTNVGSFGHAKHPLSTAFVVDPAVAPVDVVAGFFDAIRARDVEAAFTLVSADVAAAVRPADLSHGYDVSRGCFEDLITAFPNLRLPIERTLAIPYGGVLCEVTFERTQAADIPGVVNEEQHLDIEQAWLLMVRGARSSPVLGQNKLYRRLTMKRLDQISIAP